LGVWLSQMIFVKHCNNILVKLFHGFWHVESHM
jgi:hypothetical protein